MSDGDWNHFCDERGGPVAGGVNWDAAGGTWDTGAIAVVGINGPDLPEPEAPS